jgi:hypothetical protein
LSDRKVGVGKISNIKNPKNITSIPPILLNHTFPSINKPPSAPANKPRSIKTKLKPSTKNNPFIKTFDLLLSILFPLIFLMDEPLINVKYAGTKGKVHGARKVSSPAINDGIMSSNILK